MGEQPNSGKQEFKIIGKIDLDKFKKPEKPNFGEMLNTKLKAMSERINDRYGYFLKSDGSVAMDSPAYQFPDKDLDQSFVENKEEEFAAKKKITHAAWSAEREKVRGIVTEKALTLILDKVLGDDFIIARTATYDDYRHGVDTLIIDKTTGNPICGVDEMGADDAHSYQKKGQKIYDIINHNGAFVKYGATFKNGALQQKSIKNVPAFYLALDEHDLDKVLPAIAKDELSEAEIDIFGRIISSFDHQIASLYKDYINIDNNPFDLRKELLAEYANQPTNFDLSDWKKRMGQNNLRLNLLNFQKSLQSMKETYQKVKAK
jgi:hypothetical protein